MNSLTQQTTDKQEQKKLVKFFNLQFRKMMEQCHKKCITTKNKGKLGIAEKACTDRCVIKYIQTTAYVNELLNSFSQEVDQTLQMQQQQSQQK
ncbi:import inner membrane translocase subunit tim10 [Anaeramoeba flamelloides]|uniref:Mitochondrial import inner membrane translocase subunit n=1 Tax=Anaeramoeba flamelloides TaxID=1746091 RepID=A0ABQ8XXW4_9EUKA|nr:import inner membrane translocase subunit tim10 [Anaeramoeba flamelloides]